MNITRLHRPAHLVQTTPAGLPTDGVPTFHTPTVRVLPDSTAVVGWTGSTDEDHTGQAGVRERG